MTDKAKVDVLNELINKYFFSPFPHERTWIFYALKEIKDDIKSKEQVINKACEWLKINIPNGAATYESVLDMVNEFKKAMED